jgi:hypothetical protein
VLAILRLVAEFNAQPKGKAEPGPKTLDLSEFRTYLRASIMPGGIGFDILEDRGMRIVRGLIDLLIVGQSRVRHCHCGKLFVAVDLRKVYCSNTCCQKKWYDGHTDAERERKLKYYYETRRRNLRAAKDHIRARRTHQKSTKKKSQLMPKASSLRG